MNIISYDSSVLNGVKTDFFICSVENWPKMIEGAKRDFRSDHASGFSFKIVFVGRNKDVIEVYFMSKQSAAPLESSVNVSSYGSTMKLGSQMFQAINKCIWYHIATFLRRDVKGCNMANDTLKLQISFNIYNTLDVDLRGWDQFKSDFQELLDSGKGSDLVIISSDNVEFKVHKLILTSRSVVMKAHFEHNTIECKTNKMNCCYKAEVVTKLLQYIYTGRIDNLDDCAPTLLDVAEFYKLEALKEMCEESLKNQLTTENAIKTLQIAYLHGANDLKNSVLAFIKAGEAYNITKTQGWKEMHQLHLTKEIYEYVLADEQEEHSILS